LLLHSPLDQGNANVFQSYPGDPDGNTTERLAHVLFSELIVKADVAIDLHTPTTGGEYLPFAFVPPASYGESATLARSMAQAFGVRAILGFEGSRYTSNQTPHVAAAARGVAAFGIELGAGGRVNPAQVAAGSAGVRNVLKHLEMLPGEARVNDIPAELRQLVPVRADRAGLLEVSHDVGGLIEQGETLATITDICGTGHSVLAAPVSGIVMRKATFPVVCTGEQVVQIGVVD
jgi:predicted deacylase